MTPQARIPDDTDTDPDEIPPTRLFAVFADERRQRILTYLTQRPGAVLVGDIAEYIAIAEGNPTEEWYERISTDLYHSHLPRMRDCGLLTYDLETESVSLTVERTVLTPYLDLTTST
ncbi:DUF7344 domain-containing protein [Halobiforma nitratireducens]|uniref:DUF7344 domain-containing protein n=1 Tax=Halobiforma nitratireducens JCM 10879 TaxID=1227454 RepID=M0MC60_9EURY|nr:hypothetical protein [Halobiforma nitratireducens]EMA42249.1 hypothetical protein C446_04380 [Halobiforma nitratireducens JCM 10879]